MVNPGIHENLMDAIAARDLISVKKCLEGGADANYTRFKDEDEPDGLLQPTTPLRLVMFCISDAMLDESQIREFKSIAEILLQHGAHPAPAMQLAEARYGKYNADADPSAFMEVWKIVAEASKKLNFPV